MTTARTPLQNQMAPYNSSSSFSLAARCNFSSLFSRKRSRSPALQVIRARRYRDEGRSRYNDNKKVDANLRVLRERIEQVKMKERLERGFKSSQHGWTYAAGYNCKLKREADASEFLQLATLVAGTIGFTCLSGTLFLCFLSLFLHSIPTF